MQKALSTLPWVEQDSLRASTSKQQITFGFKDKAKWNEDELRKAIETKTPFTTGKILAGP